MWWRITAPIPFEAPVTSTTLPSRLAMRVLSLAPRPERKTKPARMRPCRGRPRLF